MKYPYPHHSSRNYGQSLYGQNGSSEQVSFESNYTPVVVGLIATAVVTIASVWVLNKILPKQK